ncbi:asparagine--tRNA ligase [Candidatus Nitrosocosmicus arcticus]|uniref:Asparagine--tRNA ligase n=1 Tax=Candidatus Nitrosocosmicus arcticus TaxID=2035267 RepID=A0A557SXZ8_9ARCH|nr:asparagine--tRNA ligase [Candidatus Nitrosocosmicus arcticus]TVP41471.1 Asparagine-tRNA ligase [Candidatus Nitrosocosmicus arcticus]
MFKRIADLRTEDNIGSTILLRGWIHRLRKQKEKTFIILRDDRGDIIQAICPSKLCEDLTIESSIAIQGKLEKDPRAVEGGFEVKVGKISIFNIADVDYPIGEYQSDEILLDFRHLSLRTRKMINVGKLRNSLLKYSREWFDKDNWMEVTPPILVQSSVEGGSTLFEVKYFNEKAYLSQSSQLYLESMIYCLGPVWTISPSFRAEKSRTIRHLAEFTHLEAEAPWIDMNDLITIQEKVIFSIITQIREHNKKELEFLNTAAIKKLHEISIPFEKITYDRAIDILRSTECRIRDNDGKERLIEWGDDLNLESERELTKDRSNPIFVMNYPLSIKPFYVKQDPLNKMTGLAVDLLAPQGYGEISGGGIREDNLEKLKNRMRETNLNPTDYSWYLDLRKYGSVPHGGFGLGLERLLRWILDFDDIKNVTLFPRTMTRILP